MGLLSGDSKGFVLSLDLLLALIPLTLVLGFVAADMDNLLYQMEDTVFRGSADRTAFDTMDTLLETSGDPPNWEINGTVNVAGLAINDPTFGPQGGTISSSKLAFLNTNNIKNITGPNYNYYFNVTRIDNNNNLKHLGDYNGYTLAKDVVKVEKVALYEGNFTVAGAKNLDRYTGKPITYPDDGPDPNNPDYLFQTNTIDLQTYDYYVVIINRGYDSATLSINGQVVVPPSTFKGHTNYNFTVPIDPSVLNNLTNLTFNKVTVATKSNPGDSLDFYIIQVPHLSPTPDPNDISNDVYLQTPVRVDLYLWSNGT